MCPHVDLLVLVDAGDDEEDAGPPGSPREEAPQAEDDSTLVLLVRRWQGDIKIKRCRNLRKL